MKGTLQGLLRFVLQPKIALLLGLPLALLLGGWAWLAPVPGLCTLVAVMVAAGRGRIPALLDTPDDAFAQGTVPADQPKHYGAYEATVRKVYAKAGRFWGDVYWLGWRNVLFGLQYRWKPDWLKGLYTYKYLLWSVRRGRWLDRIVLEPDNPRELREWRLHAGGLFTMVLGYQLTQILNTQADVHVRPINMDGRPAFKFVRGRWLGGE